MATQFGRKAVVNLGAATSDLKARRAAFIAAERSRQVRNLDDERPGAETPVAQSIPAGPFFVPEKSMALAYILWFFLGGFSAHRFYLGYTTSGAAQLGLRFFGFVLLIAGITSPATAALGGLMVIVSTLWTLFDVFLIPGMCRNASRGRPAHASVFA